MADVKDFSRIEDTLQRLKNMYKGSVDPIEIEAFKSQIRLSIQELNQRLGREGNFELECKFMSLLREALLRVNDIDALETFRYVFSELKEAFLHGPRLDHVKSTTLTMRLMRSDLFDGNRASLIPKGAGS